MDSLSHALFVKLSVTLWAIWVARRKAIHESIFQSRPQFINCLINKFIDELDMIKEIPLVPSQGQPSILVVNNQGSKAPQWAMQKYM
jgi:hypothetical protein